MTDQMNSQNLSNGNQEPVNMSNISVISAIVMIISVFSPWFGAKSSLSGAGLSGYGGSFTISGFSTAQGMFGLLLGIAAFILVRKKHQYAAAAGLIGLFNALTVMFGGMNGGGGYSYGGYNFSASYGAQWGLYVFTVSSLLVFLFTLKNLPSDVKKRFPFLDPLQKQIDEIENKLPF